MKKISILLLVLLVTVCLGLQVAAEEKVISLPREETLYVNGLQWGPATTFNPIAASPDWPIYGIANNALVYETLFAFNMLNGEMEPLLATKYEWIDDMTIEVTLNSQAAWQNGEPVTAEDVVYTYELGKRYTTGYSGLWQYLSEIKAVGDHKIHFVMNPNNPNRLLLEHYLQNVLIVSKAIFSAKEEEVGYDEMQLRQWPNMNPVGSGPFTIYDVTDERIVLRRFDDYWGKYKWGLPAPKYMVHPIFKSNDAGNRAFEAGQVDISQQFIPRVWEMSLVKDLPIYTWYDSEPYHVPGAIPSLFINHTRKPMDDVNFRRALAYAIDYEKIPPIAVSRYSETVKSSLILPTEEDYYSQADVDEYGWEYNPEKAEQILQEAGYTKGPDGFYRMPDGSRIRLKVECPYGWTDWMVTLKIVAQSAQKIGLDIRTEFPDFGPLFDRIQNGDFDLAMWFPAGDLTPAQPWLRFQFVMYSRDIGPVGELAFRNYGRYRNPAADELIDRIAAMESKEARIAGFRELDRIFMKDVPVIPLVYRPWMFHTWNETYWTNFPTADNPYAPPQNLMVGAGVRALYEIKPVNK